MQCEGYAQHTPTAPCYNEQQSIWDLRLLLFPICDCKHITLHSFPIIYHQGILYKVSDKWCPVSKAGGSCLLLCLHYLCIDYIPAKPKDLVSHYGTVFNIIPVHLSLTYTEYTDQAQHYDHQAQYSSVQQTHVLNKLYSGNLLLGYLFRIMRLPFFLGDFWR